MSPGSTRRWPIQPLYEALDVEPYEAWVTWRISGATARKYEAQGLTDDQADRLATRAGLHPYEVWPEMLDLHVAEAGAEEQRRRDHANALRRARRAAMSPEQREVERAKARAYYAETRRAQLLRARRYRQEHLDEVRARDRDRQQGRERERRIQYAKDHYRANRVQRLEAQRRYDQRRYDQRRRQQRPEAA